MIEIILSASLYNNPTWFFNWALTFVRQYEDEHNHPPWWNDAKIELAKWGGLMEGDLGAPTFKLTFINVEDYTYFVLRWSE